jgi:hypothetical protein
MNLNGAADDFFRKRIVFPHGNFGRVTIHVSHVPPV